MNTRTVDADSYEAGYADGLAQHSVEAVRLKAENQRLRKANQMWQARCDHLDTVLEEREDA